MFCNASPLCSFAPLHLSLNHTISMPTYIPILLVLLVLPSVHAFYVPVREAIDLVTLYLNLAPTNRGFNNIERAIDDLEMCLYPPPLHLTPAQAIKSWMFPGYEGSLRERQMRGSSKRACIIAICRGVFGAYILRQVAMTSATQYFSGYSAIKDTENGANLARKGVEAIKNGANAVKAIGYK